MLEQNLYLHLKRHRVHKEVNGNIRNVGNKVINVQEIINKLIDNDFSKNDLEQYLVSPLVLIKTNAIIAVIRKNCTEYDIIDKLNFISQNIKQEPKVLGEWTTGHYAMAALYLLNSKETKKMYNDNLKNLDEYTKENIRKLIKQIPYIL